MGLHPWILHKARCRAFSFFENGTVHGAGGKSALCDTPEMTKLQPSGALAAPWSGAVAR